MRRTRIEAGQMDDMKSIGVDKEKSPNRSSAAMISLLGGYVILVITVVQGLVLMPLYLNYIGAGLYGAWLASGGILGWLSMLDMGLASFMIQRMAVAYRRKEHSLVSAYFFTGLFLLSMLMIIFVVVAGILSLFVPSWMGLSQQESATLAGCFVLAAVATSLSILNSGISGLSEALQLQLFTTVVTVIAALCGLGVTLYELLSGRGLWAIPFGLLARIIPITLANTGYSIYLLKNDIKAPLRITREQLRDIASNSPALMFASVGNAIVGQSEPAMIALLANTELVTVYVLTRRAADIVKMLLDRIGGAVYPGFSHLCGVNDKESALRTLSKILQLYSAMASLLFGSYLALNHSFVNMWVGREQYGGNTLTILIAFSLFISIRNGLVGYLYRATGEIAKGSVLITVESIVRLGLMVVLLRQFGLIGLPIAMLLSALVLKEILGRWMARQLGTTVKSPLSTMLGLSNFGYLLVLIVGMAVGIFVTASTWFYFIGLGTGYLLFSIGILLFTNPGLRETLWGLFFGPRTRPKML